MRDPKVTTIVHVDRRKLAAGDPNPIIVRRGNKRAQHYAAVIIGGPCILKSDPNKARQPKAWITTKGIVMGRRA